jgi:hypothetical protein
VRRDEEGEEERGVREGGRRDDLLTGDVDAREAGGRQEADDEQVEELSRPEAYGTPSSS